MARATGWRIGRLPTGRRLDGVIQAATVPVQKKRQTVARLSIGKPRWCQVG